MERDVRIYAYTGERGEGVIERRGAAIWKEIYEEMIMKEKGKRERDIRRDEYEGEREEWGRDIGKGGSAMEIDMRREEIGREGERENGALIWRDVRIYAYTGEREDGAIERRGAAIWKKIYEEMMMEEKGKRERDMRRDEYEGDREEWERDIGKKAVQWRQICEGMR